MRKTGIAILCEHCMFSFQLFADDGGNDNTIIWNWCPNCGRKNDIWIKFIDKNDDTTPLGLTERQAKDLRNKQDSE